MLGPYHRLSAEGIYALHPDLVIASMDGNDPSLVSQLEKLHVPVFVLNSSSLQDVTRSLELVAEILGKPDHNKLKQLRQVLMPPKVQPLVRKRVFLQVGWNPIVTVGSGTFLHELIELAGGQNVYSDASVKYPKPNAEDVLGRKVDTIILCPMTENSADEKDSRSFWTRLTAKKPVEIQAVKLDLLTKPNFTLIEGLKRLREIL